VHGYSVFLALYSFQENKSAYKHDSLFMGSFHCSVSFLFKTGTSLKSTYKVKRFILAQFWRFQSLVSWPVCFVCFW
jgi:hypothetical protein